ncbi:hypothetical protein KUTeg_006455 [Tegillarca granosa]|uniref:Intraflagellar transport protein 46 homolog n=1 Tax=Tegillarca granosa TaxID=220873 RepID=A0ABQ9FIG5_TEGGR|nr:hypothetical protein KUTeg_006455 [Tegillarca granosa]
MMNQQKVQQQQQMGTQPRQPGMPGKDPNQQSQQFNSEDDDESGSETSDEDDDDEDDDDDDDEHPPLEGNMPDIDTLMQEWPAEFEDVLREVGLPTAELDCDLGQYVELVCCKFIFPNFHLNPLST